jgi:RNA polymerase sigma factor (sigma-70 family)
MAEDLPKSSYLKCLIEKCRSGDEESWHELLDLVAPTIFGLCKKSRLSREESFDVFGQVSLQLVNTIASLRSPEKIVSFVATITRRQIYGYYKKIQALEFLDEQTVLSLADENQSDPETDLVRSSQREILLEAMSHLSERDFRLIKMLFFDPEEPSYVEIARKLKMPVSSVGPIRGKALAKLYQILKRKGVEFWVF